MIQLGVLRLDETQNPGPPRRRRRNPSPPPFIEKHSPPAKNSAEKFLNTLDPPERPSSSLSFHVSLDGFDDKANESTLLNTPSKLAARAKKFSSETENSRPTSSLLDPLSSPLPPSASRSGRFSRALDKPLGTGSSRKRRY